MSRYRTAQDLRARQLEAEQARKKQAINAAIRLNPEMFISEATLKQLDLVDVQKRITQLMKIKDLHLIDQANLKNLCWRRDQLLKQEARAA